MQLRVGLSGLENDHTLYCQRHIYISFVDHSNTHYYFNIFFKKEPKTRRLGNN